MEQTTRHNQDSSSCAAALPEPAALPGPTGSAERTQSRPAVRMRGRLPLEELAEDPRKLRRMILILAWPMAAEMFLHTLTQIVDMVMVSRLGEVAVAAVGLSFRPLFFVMSIFLGISAGTTALVARSMGDAAIGKRRTGSRSRPCSPRQASRSCCPQLCISLRLRYSDSWAPRQRCCLPAWVTSAP